LITFQPKPPLAFSCGTILDIQRYITKIPMEIILKVANTAYPDGTLVKYLFGMRQPEIVYSGIQVKKDMWLKKAGKQIMELRNRTSKLVG